MSVPSSNQDSSRRESVFFLAFFCGCLLFHGWVMGEGWSNRNLPGVEYRQAQTAIAAYYIQQNHDFSLAYPTPVLGKPWSIPMEFPLYQWTVVGVSDLTGLNLTKSGRLVSIACFYLCLPAVFLLLGRMGVVTGRRWLVLAVLVTSPFYLFYARAFLIETMALMFSLWFWVAFEETVETKNFRWLLVAMLAGSGAGLVKVTTFLLYLLPAGWWALRKLWQGRNDRRWRSDLVWMILAVALPFALTLWWLHFADGIRALNPSARFLLEANLRDITLGTWTTRFSPELWRLKWKIITEKLSWWPLLSSGMVVLLLLARQRRADIFRLLLWFSAVLVIFPVLYGWHEYYFNANGLLLLMALGLVLVGLAESGRPFWLVGLALVTVTGGQVCRYFDVYYEEQSRPSIGGDQLTNSLGKLTKPDEILLITGQDWNSMTPYYARRRALMIREDVEQNTAQLDAAFAALAGEKIGALVLGPATRGREDIIRRAAALGIDPRPIYRWRDVSVHLPLARRKEIIQTIIDTGIDGLVWESGVELPGNPLAGEWFDTADLSPRQREIFRQMRPQPVSFFSTFGPILDGSTGRLLFGAHPVTRLVFQLQAGKHTLRTQAWFAPAAYDESLAESQCTDGAEISVTLLGAGEERKTVFTRVLDPRHQTGDRGWQQIEVAFALEKSGKIELFVGPGPQGQDRRDWVSLGPVVITNH